MLARMQLSASCLSPRSHIEVRADSQRYEMSRRKLRPLGRKASPMWPASHLTHTVSEALDSFRGVLEQPRCSIHLTFSRSCPPLRHDSGFHRRRRLFKRLPDGFSRLPSVCQAHLPFPTPPVNCTRSLYHLPTATHTSHLLRIMRCSAAHSTACLLALVSLALVTLGTTVQAAAHPPLIRRSSLNTRQDTRPDSTPQTTPQTSDHASPVQWGADEEKREEIKKVRQGEKDERRQQSAHHSRPRFAASLRADVPRTVPKV